MSATSNALRKVFTAGRPLVEQWLDIGEQIAALREVATADGLDWSQVKALLKAQIQDERDEGCDGKRVKRIVEKAEFASAYADMLGLANMNENNFSAEPHDPETGEVEEQKSAGNELPAEARPPSARPMESSATIPDPSGEAASEDPSADHVSPPALQPEMGGGSASEGGEDVTDAELPRTEMAPSEGQASLAAREGKQAAAPIPDDDVPAFLKQDRQPLNERCERPKDCKYAHHPQKLTCSTCKTAWQIAQRRSAA